jgi:hypothetical protein
MIAKALLCIEVNCEFERNELVNSYVTAGT